MTTRMSVILMDLNMIIFNVTRAPFSHQKHYSPLAFACSKPQYHNPNSSSIPYSSQIVSSHHPMGISANCSLVQAIKPKLTGYQDLDYIFIRFIFRSLILVIALTRVMALFAVHSASFILFHRIRFFPPVLLQEIPLRIIPVS